MYVRASYRGVWCWQKHGEAASPACLTISMCKRVCEGASRDIYLHWMNPGCTDRWQQQQHRADRKRKGKRPGSLVSHVVSSWAILLRTQHPGEALSFILLRFIMRPETCWQPKVVHCLLIPKRSACYFFFFPRVLSLVRACLEWKPSMLWKQQ